MDPTFLNTSSWNGSLYMFPLVSLSRPGLTFPFSTEVAFFINSSRPRRRSLLVFEIQLPMLLFLRLFKTTRNERWSRLARNISTSFWHIFACPHGLCICVVKPLSNLFKGCFVVFQQYLMIDAIHCNFPMTCLPWIVVLCIFKCLDIAS